MNPTPDDATAPAPTPDRTRTPAHPGPHHTAEPTTLGEFVVIRKIGEGGMGAVYLAEDRKLGRKAAVKTMRPELAADATNRDRFAREARAAAAVESDYIVPVWQIGEAADGAPFIAMPFLQGEMLDARLKRDGRTSAALVLKVALEVAHGLAAAHAAGLIHRDIKPGNIWLEGDPTAPEPARQVRRCKVLDFGLARAVGPDDANVTATGAILGTPAYMAPEQARGERVDHRADLFSLGVTLYRMATGVAPFRGASAMAVLVALATETPEPVARLAPHLPPGLSALIDQLMSKNPADRPASAADVAAAVKRLARDFQAPKAGPQPVPVPIPVPPPAPDPFADLTEPDADRTEPELPAPPKRGFPIALVGAALALVALAAGGAWLATRGTKSEPDVATNPPSELRPKPSDQKPVPPAEPNRAAAEWVLARGGNVQVNDLGKVLQASGQLPPAPFRLVAVNLNEKLPNNCDADLALIARCTELNFLDLKGCDVGDPGLKHFAGHSRLTSVDVTGARRVTDAGLKHLAKCRHLVGLILNGTEIGDGGLTELALGELFHLEADRTRITDEGLKQLRRSGDLYSVSLANTLVTSAGLEHLAALPHLGVLNLTGTAVTDAGLTHLRRCPELAILDLTSTAVTDAGMNTLKGFPALTDLKLKGTEVTAARVKELARALPGCRIEWNGGTELPAANERRAAEWVLGLGGKVELVGGRAVERAAALPKEPFRIARVELLDCTTLKGQSFAPLRDCTAVTDLLVSGPDLTDNQFAPLAHWTELQGLTLFSPKLTNGALDHFKNCKRVRWFNLQIAGITDAGLAHFAGCEPEQLWLPNTKITAKGLGALKLGPKLRSLNLYGVKLDDATAAAFRACTGVQHLALANSQLTDTGLAHFVNPALASVDARDTRVTDAGLERLRGASLRELQLDGTAVTDTGLAALKGQTGLTVLKLKRTKVTEAGVKELAGALPKCTIEWDKGTIRP